MNISKREQHQQQRRRQLEEVIVPTWKRASPFCDNDKNYDDKEEMQTPPFCDLKRQQALTPKQIKKALRWNSIVLFLSEQEHQKRQHKEQPIKKGKDLLILRQDTKQTIKSQLPSSGSSSNEMMESSVIPAYNSLQRQIAMNSDQLFDHLQKEQSSSTTRIRNIPTEIEHDNNNDNYVKKISMNGVSSYVLKLAPREELLSPIFGNQRSCQPLDNE